MGVKIIHGKCENILPTLPDCSVDAVVTDPPYELGFMGKGWDSTGIAYSVPMWAEVLRVLKPGGHLLSFGGSRTWHRMAVAIEDAGFEMRDCITWHFGSGFPKSLDVSKAIDRMAGAEREVVGIKTRPDGSRRPNAGEWAAGMGYMGNDATPEITTAPATPDAARWEGWGTALKPATEFIVMARKPFAGTVAANVLQWGTGALNIDGCRVGTPSQVKPQIRPTTDVGGGSWSKGDHVPFHYPPGGGGRWPANVLFDEFAADLLDAQSGTVPSGIAVTRNGGGRNIFGSQSDGKPVPDSGYSDTGGASRFFWCSKAPKSERPKVNGIAHATVKPLTLIRYLVRLVTPPGGTVLDPFAGSGTTGEACIHEGFDAILIEREADHIPLIEYRINRATDEMGLFGEMGA